MCIYCEMWGDGIYPWYLNPRNYARHLYSVRPKVRQATAPKSEANPAGYITGEKEIVDGMEQGVEAYKAALKRQRDYMDAEQGSIGGWMGQVVPLQDMERMVEICGPLGIIGCICRLRFLGLDEHDENDMTCMGMGVGMVKWERWPERYKHGVYFVSSEEAKEWLRKLNKKGFVHSLMMFGPRFIGGICNCDYPACDSIQGRLDMGTNMLKGHHVAVVDEDKCNGCGICAQRCQFGALKFNVTNDKAGIDQYRCFGCGLCQTACPRGAIELVLRDKIPALQEVW